ncbi:hypothetical protein HK107_14965 [Parvularcula sp. ZS-1/3]|uniref:Uncharacterized protein n=1 Tax=Parvularcula mediterranea TaxID=2732508 RepID=A0A7Y3W6U2_9PROT|nr:hypothetical protein [Parvularcula mediterranea]NNU17631.1 hypothetical protein [Parvularcula mediterranea]
MTNSYRSRAGLAATAGLAIPVITTAAYMTFLGGPDERGPAVYFTERMDDIITVWLTETVGFAIGIIAALGLAAQAGAERASWNAIALGSLGGLLSTAIGIAAFPGFATNGEQFLPLFMAVLNLSFFFFFLGKAATALGVLGLGIELVRRGGGIGKVVGLLAVLAGLVGGAINIVAMGSGLDLVMPAGLTGVIATVVGAVAAFLITRQAPQGAE